MEIASTPSIFFICRNIILVQFGCIYKTFFFKNKSYPRKFSRVVRIEISKSFDDYLLKSLKERFKVDDLNIMRLKSNTILDYTSLNQIIDYNEFSELLPNYPSPIKSIDMEGDNEKSIFEILSDRDVFLHHPYNSFDPVIKLLNEAADDPNVLSIKITLYRTAKNSGVIDALLKAAEKGKHVSVLFEVKARFDEENNLRNVNFEKF